MAMDTSVAWQRALVRREDLRDLQTTICYETRKFSPAAGAVLWIASERPSLDAQIATAPMQYGTQLGDGASVIAREGRRKHL
jgi:hypothetical protein